MTREEIINRMDEIETKRFYLGMKDRWNGNDYETDNQLLNEWLKLNRELKKIA